MLLTTGIIALSRKIADEKEKKKEQRQGALKIGDSDVAKRAFQSHTSKLLTSGDTGIKRAGTDIRYEDANDISARSPDTISPNIYSPIVEIQDTRQKSQLDAMSPVKSERGMLSPSSETPTTPSDFTNRRPESSASQLPPPYSPTARSSVRSPSEYTRDTDGASSWDTKSIASRSTNSQGTHAIRVKTIGGDLKSGFPYPASLFEVNVHPDQWRAFTHDIVNGTKFGTGDYAKMWGAATATAMTGAIATSIFVGRSMNRSLQEKKVKEGLSNMSDGGLGDTLKQWNEEYFNKLGLFAHLELSESALKSPNQKTKTLHKSAFLYSHKEDRERKREERKFVIVVTKLDEEGQPMEALRELDGKIEGTEAAPVEIGSSDDPTLLSTVAELPGDGQVVPVELPAEGAYSSEKKFEPPAGFIEMDSDNTYLLERMHLDEKTEANPGATERNPKPQPLMVTANTHAALYKETT